MGDRCGAFFFVTFLPVLIVMFSEFYLELWSPCWGRRSGLLCFSLACALCTVCLDLLALPLVVIGRLWPMICNIRHLLSYVFQFPMFLLLLVLRRYFCCGSSLFVYSLFVCSTFVKCCFGLSIHIILPGLHSVKRNTGVWFSKIYFASSEGLLLNRLMWPLFRE